MIVVRHSGSRVELEVDGQPLHLCRRADRYIKPRRWRRPREEVEIWALEDGREVRLSRVHHTQPWQARWR